MSRAHLRLQKTIQPYTDSLNELVKAIPPVTNKLAVYPAVRGLLFPGEEGKRTFKYLSPRVHTFDMMAKNATKVAESVLNQAHRYLRTIAEMYAPVEDYKRLLSEDAAGTGILLVIASPVIHDLYAEFGLTSDEVLLAAKRSPSSSQVTADFFAHFCFELAELRTDFRKLDAAMGNVLKVFADRAVHRTLCPNCLKAAVCHDADMN
jgi:hypothetical protein